MYETHVTLIGNVLTAPEWRRTSNTDTLVANFRVASTARRWDRSAKGWVDGESLRVRVNCWRKLAEGVASSVMVGDPVIVVGRLYTRDWVDQDNHHRTAYELEAVAVGHDLSRGRGRFARNRPTMATSEIADDDAEGRVHGEPAAAVPDDEAPARRGSSPLDDDGLPAADFDRLAGLRGSHYRTDNDLLSPIDQDATFEAGDGEPEAIPDSDAPGAPASRGSLSSGGSLPSGGSLSSGGSLPSDGSLSSGAVGASVATGAVSVGAADFGFFDWRLTGLGAVLGFGMRSDTSRSYTLAYRISCSSMSMLAPVPLRSLRSMARLLITMDA